MWSLPCTACYISQKTFKRELEVENWIKKFDEEMGEKQVRCNL